MTLFEFAPLSGENFTKADSNHNTNEKNSFVYKLVSWGLEPGLESIRKRRRRKEKNLDSFVYVCSKDKTWPES